MATALRKKSPAYEEGLREGRADKTKKPSIEIEIKPEGEEESPEPGEEKEMDSSAALPKAHSRKRSAKNANNTKAPMDGGMYGKKPMDGEGCGCGGAKKGRKASCDGNCGGYAKKMDALTPQEYLAACELGIQGRSRTYIRARLDSATRLDLKCGNGSVSQGEKCTKGTVQKAQSNKASVGQRVKAGASLLAIGAGTVGQAAFTGAAFGAGLSGNAKAAGRYTQAAAGFGALKGAGLAGVGAKKAAREELAGAASGALVGSLLSGDLEKGARAVGRAAREGAPMTVKRLKHARSNAKGRARLAAMRNTPLPKAQTMYGRMVDPWAGRRDSVYAAGFSPELDQLAI